jgi:hypothetical protein
MNREVHVRFWERLRVKVPRATRQRTNPLTREGLAARSSDYVYSSNYLNERK